MGPVWIKIDRKYLSFRNSKGFKSSVLGSHDKDWICFLLYARVFMYIQFFQHHLLKTNSLSIEYLLVLFLKKSLDHMSVSYTQTLYAFHFSVSVSEIVWLNLFLNITYFWWYCKVTFILTLYNWFLYTDHFVSCSHIKLTFGSRNLFL